MTKKPKSSLAKLWVGLRVVACRGQDLQAFSGQRLASIEARLSALDGGDDAAAARRAALAAAEDARVQHGGRPLGFRLVGPQANSIEWISKDTKIDD